MSAATPVVSVVIVTWNARDELARCLAALGRQTDRDFEVIVVDNGSRDDSRAVVRDAFPAARWVPLAENVGFAAGCNRGMAEARGEWIFTLNNDAEPRPTCLETLKAAARDAPPSVGMLQPLVVFRDRPDRVNSTGVALYRDGTADDRDFGRRVDACRPDEDVFCVTAGAALYRRRMLDETPLAAGVFDPRHFLYFEDLDLGWRCRLAGWEARYVGAAVVRHVFQATSRRRGKHFVTLQCMRNRVRTLCKNASFGLIARTAFRSARDFVWTFRHDGGGALARWVTAVRDGFAERRRVSALARVPRRDVERRWLRKRTRRGGGLAPPELASE